MNRFIETLCIQDGNAMHLAWHQARVDLTFRLCMAFAKPFSIEAVLAKQMDIPSVGKVKCTIEYGPDDQAIRSVLYEPKQIHTLKLVEIPAGFDYRFKYADRSMIDRLYAWRGEADDSLMTRGGWIMDTSYANIAFLKNNRWYTPAQPLLAGTTWKRLIHEGIIIPRPIHQAEIQHMEAFKIFNAMNSWWEIEAYPTSGVK
jgi:4-amino-4-deoxychorismate lyase